MARTASLGLWIAAASFAGGVGCYEQRTAEVMVHLATDLPDSAFDHVEIIARSGAEESRSGAIAWQPDATFTVLEPRAGSDETVELEVTLLRGEETVYRTKRGIERFERRHTLHAWMFIETQCHLAEGSLCILDQVCGRCGCESFFLPATNDATASPWEDPCPDIGNGQPMLDAGEAGDAGQADAPPPDAGELHPTCESSATRNRSYVARAETSLNFGIDDLFSLPPPFTVEVWVRVTQDPVQDLVVMSAEKSVFHWSLSIDAAQPYVRFKLGSTPIETNISCNWPIDGEWHHLAVELDRDPPNVWAGLYLDGTRCAQGEMITAWANVGAHLEVPAANQDPHMFIDGVHLRQQAPYWSTFTPAIVPSADQDTVALWLMDEENASIVAHDVACRHPGTVQENSFSDDAPQ